LGGWVSFVHTPRQYLLLRNAWDFNDSLLRRVYTRDFVAHLQAATRDEFDPYFDGDGTVLSRALRAEFSTKMVSDLLHNENTMSMAHSVESRVPLLDLELVRFAARIPPDLRFQGGLKGLLKKVLDGILPEQVLTKKKWGFTFDPVEQYKKDLRSLALEVLTPERLQRSGVFNPDFVRRVLDAKPHQRLRWHYFMLWQMIGVEIWQDTFVARQVTPTPTGRPSRRAAVAGGT
jgi:asparagine synthase (glutamine-hydrolysing)